MQFGRIARRSLTARETILIASLYCIISSSPSCLHARTHTSLLFIDHHDHCSVKSYDDTRCFVFLQLLLNGVGGGERAFPRPIKLLSNEMIFRAIREKLNSFNELHSLPLVQFCELVQFIPELHSKSFNLII